MPIDASIPMGVRPPQIESPMNALAQAMQIQGLQQRGDMNRLAMEETKRGIEDQNRLRGVLQGGGDASALRQGGFLKEANEWEKNSAEVDHKRSDTTKNKAEVALKKVGLYRDAVNGVNDAGSIVAYIQAMHADPDLKGSAITAVPVEKLIAQVPQDPAQLAQWKQQFVLGADKYAADQRARETQAITLRGQDVTAETSRRGQDIGASTARRGQDITVRGQDKVDQRASERLEFERGNLVAESGGPSQVALVKKFGKPEKGYRWKEDGTVEAIPGGSAATGKALPTKLITDLTEQSGTADTTERLRGSFKDEFAGKTILGDWSNTFKRVAGDDTGQSQWWQDYALHESTIRNKLFGASLTPGEQAEWARLTVSPRMNADEAKQNLQRRADIEKRGLDRLMTSSAKAGYNKDQIEALTGRPIGGAPSPAAPASGIPSDIADILKKHGGK